MDPEHVVRYSIPSEADVLIAFSTFPGRVAHRDTKDGSWFVQELCNELEETGNSDDILSILTKVNRRVALNYEYLTFKQMPMIQSTLTRKISFGGQSKVITRDNQGLFPEEKLDTILELLRDMKPTQESRRVSNKPRPSSEWDKLKPSNVSFEITQSDGQIVKVATALKLLLSEKKQLLTSGVRDEGYTLLNLLSVWGSLAQDQRCFAYKKLDNFLRTHGKEWEYLKMVNLPQIGPEKSRRFSFSSPTSKTSSSTFGSDGHQSIDRRIVRRNNK